MNAVRNTVTLPEVNPSLLCGNIITQHTKILTNGIASFRLLKIRGEKGTSQ